MKKSKIIRMFYKTLVFLFVFFQASYIYLLKLPNIQGANSALTLTNASVTLSNSRLSYKGGVSSSPPSSGASLVSIDSSGQGDNDTDNLFPSDTVCFVDSGQNGCKGDTSYTVNGITDQTDGTQFAITPTLTTDLAATDYVVASQEGTMTVRFTNQTEIPVGGTIVVTVPTVNTDNKTNDGIPDTAGSLAANGFDLKDIVAGVVSTTGCTDGNWNTTETFDYGGSGSDATITIARINAVCAASTAITVTIGSGASGVINPAPVTDSATQGVADIYTLDVTTYSGAVALDTADIDFAPNEGVLVQATVDETLAFTVAGVASSATDCGTGATTDVTTTFNEVNFGEISDASNFVDAEQQLTVSTNADDGYEVYVEENDEMGLNGGTTPNIPDTPCDSGPCTHLASQEWNTATSYGFGYSLANSSGTDAEFLYSESSRSFSAKQFPNNAEGSTQFTADGAEIMSNAGPVSGSSAFVCFRTNVSAVQEPGLYYNKIRYTATATF